MRRANTFTYMLLVILVHIIPSSRHLFVVMGITTCAEGYYDVESICTKCPVEKPYTYTRDGKRIGATSINACYAKNTCTANEVNVKYKWGTQQIYHAQSSIATQTTIDATNYNAPSNIYSVTSSFALNNENNETEIIVTNMLTKVCTTT